MGHHDFDPPAELAEQMGVKSLIDQLNDAKDRETQLEKTAEIELKMASIQERLGEPPSREEMLESLRQIAEENEIPEEIRERMRRDRATAEAKQRG